MRSRTPLPAGFGVLWTTVAIDLIGFGMVLPVLPLYARRLHASPLAAAVLVAVFSAASFVCSPLWGRLSDRIGRKPVLLVSLAGTAVGSLLTGLAGGLVLLIVARLIDGASGASVSVAQASATDLAPEGQRSRLLGYLGAAFGVGLVAGPALGGLAALVGPRLPFFLAAAIAGVNALVAIRRLPETRPATPVIKQPRGRADPAIATLIGVAFAALIAFSAFEATFSVFGRARFHLTLGSAAGVFAAAGMVLVVVQGGAAHTLVARFGATPVLIGGLLLDAAGLMLLASAHSWDLAAPALAVLTVGEGLVQTTMATALADRAEPHRRGEVLGWQQSAGGLARVAGPVAGGAMIGGGASGVAYVAGGALCAAAAAAVGVVVSRAWRLRSSLPGRRADITIK